MPAILPASIPSSAPGAPLASGRPAPRLSGLRRWAFLLLLTGALAAQTAPKFAALAAAARAARDANRLDQAATLYQQALALRPGWAQGWWYLGTIRYDQNHNRQAARAFQRLLALRPNAGSAHALLGLCQFALGDDRNALQNIAQGLHLGIASDPQMRRVLLYHQGILLRRLGRLEDAHDVFSTLCADQVENRSLDRELGLVELRIPGKSPATPAGGDDVIVRLGQAGCLAAQSKFTEARGAFADLTRQYPQFPGIHDARGQFLLQVHDPEAAIGEFKQAIAASPREIFARLEIAAAFYRVNSAAGLPYAEQAVRIAPRQPLGHYFLGLLLADTGHFHRALPELEIARKVLPNDTKIWFALGTAYARLGQRQKALEAWATFQRLKRKAAASASQNRAYGEQSDSSRLPGDASAPPAETSTGPNHHE